MTNVKTLIYKKETIADILIFTSIYFVPTLSHYFALPLYILDPMRFAVLGSLLILNNKKNAYFLALTLPLFSFMISGHPIAIKNLIISIELCSNLFLFELLASKIESVSIGMFTSIFMSKIFYYLLKYGAITFGLMTTTLVDTSIVIQTVVAICISTLFAKYYKK